MYLKPCRELPKSTIRTATTNAGTIRNELTVHRTVDISFYRTVRSHDLVAKPGIFPALVLVNLDSGKPTQHTKHEACKFY